MKKMKFAGVCFMAVLILGLMGPSCDGQAAEQSSAQKAEQKADQKALKEGLQESLGVQVLTGEVWQQMTYDTKVAFIWGFGHVVSIEQHLMEKFTELKRDSFVAKVVEGMADIPMDKVVARVDEYYSSNQNQIQTPVTNVVWDLMIKPNIKMGIAGRPLR